jgi:predicted PurR-regulated permease PerM
MSAPTAAGPTSASSPAAGAATAHLDPGAAAPASPGDDAGAEAETRPPRPRSSSAAVVIATVLVVGVLWVAADLIVPIVLGMFFALVGNPIIRGLRRLYVPRFLGAAAVLAGGLASAVLLGNLLVEPATESMRQMPREIRQMAPKLRAMAQPMQEANKAAKSIARAAGGEDANTVRVVKTETDDPYRALTATPKLLTSVLAVVLLTFFFMAFGENLQRNVLALLPDRQKKKVTLDILQSIERELSRYVLTISVINALLGLALACGLVLLGLGWPEAMLWGTVAMLLNFAPYVGPLIGVVLMLMMGFLNFDDPVRALLPAGVYLLLHTLEGQLLTPIVLGRRMAISPLMLILGLMVFGWLWGVAGLLLAVPLLVCTKLVLERIGGMEGWARLLS